MAAQKGKDLLLKIEDAPGLFVTVAGLRTQTLALNAQTVDASSADGGGWRELLAGAGLRSCRVTGAGVFKDAAADALARASFFAQDARAWRLIIPDFGTLQGPFLIEALEYAGEYDGEATFALTLASAGALTFEAA